MDMKRVRQRAARAWRVVGHVGVKPLASAESRSIIATNQFSLICLIVTIPYGTVLLLYHYPDLWVPGVILYGLAASWLLAIGLNSRRLYRLASSVALLAVILGSVFLTAYLTTDSGFQLPLFTGGVLGFALFRPEYRISRAGAGVLSVAMLVHCEVSWPGDRVRHVIPEQLNQWLFAINAIATVVILYILGRFDLRYYEVEREKNAALLAAAQVAAQTDALTDVYNRRGIAPVLSSVARRCDYSLALVDLDRFKLINDRLGHGAGDVVLANAARTLVRSVGDDGVVARWGGEEFLVVLPSMSLADADALMERAREDMEEEYGAPESLARVTISVGLAHAPRYSGKEEVLRLADANLYEAKSSGRNVVVSARLVPANI
jgi:diguanylate cyclase (GGDEF)-like protein